MLQHVKNNKNENSKNTKANKHDGKNGTQITRTSKNDKKTAVRKRMIRLQTKAQAEKLKKKTASGKLFRVSAYHLGRGLRTSLSLCGTSLGVWKKHETCRPLLANEERYYTAPKRMFPYDIPEGVEWRRCCVYNQEFKKTRFEVDVGLVEHHPVLSAVYDLGPRDLPIWVYLPYVMRFVGIDDPLHRTPNDMKAAANEVLCWHTIQDSIAVLNYDRGPFLSQNNFARLREGVEYWATQLSFDDEDLMENFEEICIAMRDMPADFGSADHVKRVLGSIHLDELFVAMPEKVKWTRWASHHWTCKEFLPKMPLKRFAFRICKKLTEAIKC